MPPPEARESRVQTPEDTIKMDNGPATEDRPGSGTHSKNKNSRVGNAKGCEGAIVPLNCRYCLAVKIQMFWWCLE